MDKVDTVMVAFSATSIHKKLAMQALDVAVRNNAKLVILNIRDKNIAEKVARVTKNHGFLGEKLVEKLKEDIIKDRDKVISKRLAMLENKAEDRGIIFETVQVKGDFVENVVNIAEKYDTDVILLEDVGKKIDKLKQNVRGVIVVVE